MNWGSILGGLRGNLQMGNAAQGMQRELGLLDRFRSGMRGMQGAGGLLGGMGREEDMPMPQFLLSPRPDPRLMEMALQMMRAGQRGRV